MDSLEKLAENISEVSVESLVETYDRVRESREELEAGMKVIRDELLDRLHKANLPGDKTANGFYYTIKKYYSFSGISADTAAGLGAVSAQVDTKKIKALYESGKDIEGLVVSEGVDIRRAKEMP